MTLKHNSAMSLKSHDFSSHVNSNLSIYGMVVTILNLKLFQNDFLFYMGSISFLMGPWKEGYTSMANSLAHMMNKSMQSTESPQDLDKYKNMQKFMTTALCKNDKQSNNIDLKIPDLPNLDLLEESRG